MAVTLFSYKKGNSIIHKIPALIKLFILVIFCVLTFSGGTLNSINEILEIPLILRTTFCFLFSISFFILSGANWNSLKQLNFVFILGLAVTLFKFFYFPQDTTILQQENKFLIYVIPGFYLNLNGLASGGLYTIRFLTTTLLAQVIFETTSSLEIKNALESFQNAISKIFPPLKKWNPAFVISLAINFIPQIFDTWNKIHLAALARSENKKNNLIQVIKNTFFEIQALFSCLLHQAETKRLAILNREKQENL